MGSMLRRIPPVPPANYDTLFRTLKQDHVSAGHQKGRDQLLLLLTDEQVPTSSLYQPFLHCSSEAQV